LAEVEVLRTLDRLRLRDELTLEDAAERRGAAFRLLHAVSLADVSAPILRRAADPFPTPLGTLDAIHLATALAWREVPHPDLIVATHDAPLGIAARACGFEVLGTAG
jgi:predicted nucleic acid-binding protein